MSEKFLYKIYYVACFVVFYLSGNNFILALLVMLVTNITSVMCVQCNYHHDDHHHRRAITTIICVKCNHHHDDIDDFPIDVSLLFRSFQADYLHPVFRLVLFLNFNTEILKICSKQMTNVEHI